MSLADRLAAVFRASAAPEPAPESAAAEALAPPVWELLSSRSGSHLYFLNPDHVQTGLLDLVVVPPRRVLDVGCYCGATGETIKRRWPGATVIGIEPLAEAAQLAAPRIDRVITGTFESVDFDAAGIPPKSIDAIVLADVLEHMYNPWAALQKMRGLLADDGIVLASIPNTRNLSLIHALASGHWTYAGGGLLDITHIRFFTFSEIARMFEETGYVVHQVEQNPDPGLRQLWDIEPPAEGATVKLGKLAVSGLTRDDVRELATLQFYVRAGKKR